MILVLMIVIVAVLAYTWLVYPAVMLWGWRKSGAQRGVDLTRSDELPRVAVLLSAHSEEGVIQARLDNLAALDYPAERVTVLVGVDGGSDRTAEIARIWADGRPHAHVLASPVNRGKTAMLRDLVAKVRGLDPTATAPAESSESGPQSSSRRPVILVFTDANTMFDPDALRCLVEPFADPRIGGTCGRLVFHSPGEMAMDEPHYWDIETRLKEAESRLDSCLGANGAIYAIRCDLFPAIPDNVIIDDFVIGMKVREQGFRMVFVDRACAREDLPQTVSEEWRRRVRIGAGAYQALSLCRSCLAPRFGLFAWMFWSHKVLRWFTPHLLIVFVGAAGIVFVEWMRFCAARGGWWGVVAGSWAGWAGAAACAIALVCLLARRSEATWARPFRMMGYFAVMQAALLTGFLHFCRGDLRGTWKRTERNR